MKTYHLLLLIGGLMFVVFGLLSSSYEELGCLVILGWLIWMAGCVLYWRRDK